MRGFFKLSYLVAMIFIVAPLHGQRSGGLSIILFSILSGLSFNRYCSNSNVSCVKNNQYY